MNVEVLRIGQRVIRDDRVTTHVALVARAFGASKIYMNEVDPEIENTIKRMNKTWGGDFQIEFFEDWKKVLKSKIDDYKIVHLTMYGERIDDVAKGTHSSRYQELLKCFQSAHSNRKDQGNYGPSPSPFRCFAPSTERSPKS